MPELLVRWTPLARECFKRGCVCKDCPLEEQLETPCRMKYTVIKLVQRFGSPKGVKEKTTMGE